MSWLKLDKGIAPSTGFDGQIVGVKLDAAMDVDVVLHKVDGGLQLAVHNLGVCKGYVCGRRQDDAHPFAPRIGMTSTGDEHRPAGCESLADHSLHCRHDQIVGPEQVIPAEVVDNDSSAHNSP